MSVHAALPVIGEFEYIEFIRQEFGEGLDFQIQKHLNHEEVLNHLPIPYGQEPIDYDYSKFIEDFSDLMEIAVPVPFPSLPAIAVVAAVKYITMNAISVLEAHMPAFTSPFFPHNVSGKWGFFPELVNHCRTMAQQRKLLMGRPHVMAKNSKKM